MIASVPTHPVEPCSAQQTHKRRHIESHCYLRQKMNYVRKSHALSKLFVFQHQGGRTSKNFIWRILSIKEAMKIGFIGGGRLAFALANGFISAGFEDPQLLPPVECKKKFTTGQF
ncbi:hypothetical protein evm_015388 [Chilo suppressalis]|nr:hypothetical protein evm_015388 [Chilo suppressalis]